MFLKMKGIGLMEIFENRLWTLEAIYSFKLDEI